MALTMEEGVTRETSVSDAIAKAPLARKIFKEHGIRFIGKELSPLESIETVARGNDLSDSDIDSIVREINESLESGEIPKDGIVILSKAAAQKLREILNSRPEKKGLRLRLASSGCSIYTYDLDFGTKPVGEEIEFEEGGIKFYMKKKDVQMFLGTKIDYNEEEDGFSFDNPNVKDD